MIDKILEVLNKYSNSIGHGEEVITESQFHFVAEQIAESLGQIVPPVIVKTAETINKFNIGDMVEINTNSEYYGDWVGVKQKVIGINLHTKANKIEYTLLDGISTSDGWEETELSKVK